MSIKDITIKQLDTLLEMGNRLEATFQLGDRGAYESSASEAELRAFGTAARAFLQNTTGGDSVFSKDVPKPPTRISVPGYEPVYIPGIVGALQALKLAVDDGWFAPIEARIRANVHDDFLEQARALLEAGYHIAAMSIVGGVLEDHLRKLCTERGLTWRGHGTLAKYNDLLKDGAYPQPVWRRIQAITDVRNDADHANWDSVKRQDVEDALDFVSRVITNYPD